MKIIRIGVDSYEDRQVLFDLVLNAVRKVCGEEVQGHHDPDRLFGGMFTYFSIPEGAHEDGTRRKGLEDELSRLYQTSNGRIRGFVLNWHLEIVNNDGAFEDAEDPVAD